jgi:hypothetical protein
MAAATVGLAACGQRPAPADRVTHLDALRLEVSAGFTSAARAFRIVPELVLTTDDRVVTPAPVAEVYPGPLLVPLTTRTLDAAGRESLADAVRRSGLATAPAPDFGSPRVADAPTTTLTVTVDGTTSRLVAPALDEAHPDDSTLTAEQHARRAALRDLVARLRDLAATVGAGHLGPEAPYVPDGVWLRVLPAPPGNPADPVQPTVREWPVPGVDLGTLTRATLVDGATGAAVLDALAGATELTWFRDDADIHQVLARPALPGDDTP